MKDFNIVKCSNAHVHLSAAHAAHFFPDGLTKLKDLGQPGEYACTQTLEVHGNKGMIVARVLGPTREHTQVELSRSDCRRIGINAPTRDSGDLAGSAGCTLALPPYAAIMQGSRKDVHLMCGVIIAKPHFHCWASSNWIDKIPRTCTLMVRSETGTWTLDGIKVRPSPSAKDELHLDTDQWNAMDLGSAIDCEISFPGVKP